MKILLCTAAMALALGAVPAVAQNQSQPAPGVIDAMTSTTARSELSQQDREFVTKAAAGGLMEVQLGRLASQKAASTDVKQFGQRMVEDHGKANELLKSIAQQKSVALPTELEGEHKQAHDRLAAIAGEQFDRQYMQAMVADHQKDVQLFRRQADQGADPDLKQFAQTTLPTLEQHLKLAQDIQQKMQPVASATDTGRTVTSQAPVTVPTQTLNAPATAAAARMDSKLGQLTAKDLIGKDVRNAKGDDIGEIENVVVGADKTLHAVVAVGGFLGFGEKEVLVPFHQLRVGENDAIMMSDTSEEALKQLPAYNKNGFEEWPRDRRLME